MHLDGGVHDLFMHGEPFPYLVVGRDAILQSARLRLRPIVMVSTAILVGLVPLALEAGGDMLQPIAIAAIGGLDMEVLVALFLMPVLYLMTNRDTLAKEERT